MGSDEQTTRRQFCQACAAGVAALGGALALQGCGGGGSPTSGDGISAASLPRVSGTLSGATMQVTIDASSPLASPGTLALVTGGGTSLLVARTGADSFTALTAQCTHAACLITAYSGQNYVCPCHGSQYDTSGRVLSGPAPRALRQYTTQFSGGVLTIS
jgi:cytochrome b6-f complex iron-sulfur subunit